MEEEITLNGTTPVLISNTTASMTIQNISKNTVKYRLAGGSVTGGTLISGCVVREESDIEAFLLDDNATAKLYVRRIS